jgi:asparagine synthase (glutamine-hydrolysing)
MCGIAGIVSTGRIDDSLIHKMTSAMHHRGPDATRVWVSENKQIALGHKRLSIQDLSAHATQPMWAKQRKVAIVFNGEIYNFKSLKTELQSLNYVFETQSDTEVLLNGYLEWGEDVVHKLNGMWAFIIYDQDKSQLFISRDRAGQKPLYLCQTDDALLISSEIKPMLRTGLVKAEVDPDALVEYFSFQNIFSNKTLFKHIEYLPAGYSAIYDLSTHKLRQYCYWDYEFKEEKNKNIEDFTHEFRELFTNSLERHMIADVPIGVTLSGGMDSSSIVSLASRQIPQLNTFTGFFDTRFIDQDDRCHSEHHDARLIAQLYNTEHHERLITHSDVINTLPSIIWHLEDPKLAMCYTFFNLSQVVSQKVTVNLSGTGGDELLGGYPWRYGLVENLSSQTEFNDIYYNYWCRLIGDKDRSDFFTAKIKNLVDLKRPRQVFDSILKDKKQDSIINQAFYFELKTFLVGMLMVEDKMGMAFSLETRFPFLDKEILDFSMCVPSSFKYKQNEAKILLKQAMKGILPEEAIYKRKQGFTPPDKTWYKNELRYYIKNMLLGRKSLIGDYIEPSSIERLLTSHNEGQADNRMIIWSMLFFEGWLRQFIHSNSELPVMF